MGPAPTTQNAMMTLLPLELTLPDEFSPLTAWVHKPLITKPNEFQKPIQVDFTWLLTTTTITTSSTRTSTTTHRDGNDIDDFSDVEEVGMRDGWRAARLQETHRDGDNVNHDNNDDSP